MHIFVGEIVLEHVIIPLAVQLRVNIFDNLILLKKYRDTVGIIIAFNMMIPGCYTIFAL